MLGIRYVSQDCQPNWMSAQIQDFLIKSSRHNYLYTLSSVGRCIPYSVEACESAAERLGLRKGGNGFKFQGPHAAKGCYAYSSGYFTRVAFYGTGGTVAQNSRPLSGRKYRPNGHDCKGSSGVVSR